MLKNVNPCRKHSKLRTNQMSTHTPTIKCHEEVMSKLSSCTNEDCVGDLNSCTEQFCYPRKEKFYKDKAKTVTSKCKLGLHQSVSAPSSRLTDQKHKDLHAKTVKSKSISIVQNSNLEDSIDFIPVKLTSAKERKQRPQRRVRQNLESRLSANSKISKPYRPTWDEILRNNLEVSSKEEKLPAKKSGKTDIYTNCMHSEQSSSRTVNKDSSMKINKCSGKNVILQGSPKSIESPKLETLPIFENNVNSSNPIKTLDYLIRQLRDGFLRQPENNTLQNIIQDMENALLKISVENKSHSNHPINTETVEKEAPGSSIPLSAVSMSSHEKMTNRHLNIAQLEHNLERSCRYLQSLCIKQKENCSSHLREKEQLSLQLAESRRLLAVSKSKEKNYEVTIGDLRLKLQEANTKIDQLKQALQEVENKNDILKEENKAMSSLKQSLKRAGVRLKQIASEKEKLQSKLSLKDLEIEKLKVLLQMKTSQKNGLQLDNVKQPDINEIKGKNFDDNDISVISLSTVTSWSERPGLICSSQASGSPGQSPSPYNSWQHISSIVQQPSAAADINQGIAIILQELKKKSEQMEPLQLEMQNPSSCSSLWSERDAVDNRVVYSDGESEGFSS